MQRVNPAVFRVSLAARRLSFLLFIWIASSIIVYLGRLIRVGELFESLIGLVVANPAIVAASAILLYAIFVTVLMRRQLQQFKSDVQKQVLSAFEAPFGLEHFRETRYGGEASLRTRSADVARAMLVELFGAMVNSYIRLGDFESAENFLAEWVNNAEELNDRLLLATTYAAWGRLLHSKGNDLDALQYFKRSLDLLQRLS